MVAYDKCSVNYRLSPTFHSNAISLRAIIPQTSGFHQSIAHSFVTLETKFHVNDLITVSVTCKKLAHVIYQLSATVIYYRPPVHFPINTVDFIVIVDTIFLLKTLYF